MLFEVSRNWSASFHRLSVGALAIFALQAIGVFQLSSFGNFSLSGSEFSNSEIIGLIAFFASSSVLGMLIQPLGNLSAFDQVFSESRRINRALLIGKTQNPLLMEACRDAEAKADLAKNLIGLVTFLVAAVLITAFLGSPQDTSRSVAPIELHRDWNMVIGGVIGVASAMWLRYVSSQSLIAIERALDRVQEISE